MTSTREFDVESANSKSIERGRSNSIADEEKRLEAGDDVIDRGRRRLEPLHTGRTHPLSKNSSRRSSRSARSQFSYAGGDGYTYYCDNPENDTGDASGDEESPKSKEESAESPSDESPSGDEKQFEVGWDGPDDSMNPKVRLSFVHKWVIVFIISSCSLCVTFASTVYTSIYIQVIPEFNTSREVATLGLSFFVCGLGLGPMLLAPLSEFYGRRPIYLVSFLFFIIWSIPCAVAQNIQTLLVTRFFGGFAGSAFLSVAGGTVGDVFAKNELSLPMMFYTASPFVGPEIGPLIGGFINDFASWRWTFYTLLIWAGVELALLFCLVPETYAPVILVQKAKKLRTETGNEKWHAPLERHERSIARTVLVSCYRPFQLLFFEPMCLNLCILSAILLGVLYLFFGAFPVVFEGNHGFTLWQVGLTFMGLFVGMVIAVACDPLWRRFVYMRLVRKREAAGGEPGGTEPEFRLPPTIVGAWIVPIGLFGFGWTTYPHVHWIVPIIFSGIFALGVIWVYAGVFTFLVECYPLYAASALAANSFARSAFAAAFPLFGVQMYHTLGDQWATSLLAFLALAMAPFPVLFFKYGKQLRSRSTFASA
ncbi:major facilitator superfamily domain-containing protein [Lineolata rhizophorae]|uniref:Major facilitator superfamily domain-containing protein n=1 Tax=Lineolata rhizophorae TaxID=578093 RepID=A0A6A6NQY4_9PEZI|nr:major facilitator superfamily domain-containing protein [Lineolata rhizophorae]